MSKEITRLKRVLLPRNLSDQTFQPSERISLKAMSFRLLAHAEFESYIEDKVRVVSDRAHTSWKNDGKVSIITLSILSFSEVVTKIPPPSIQAPSNIGQSQWRKSLCCSDNLKKAFSKFRYYVDSKNHGIKEENLLRLLLPVGLSFDKLDPLFLAEINDFAGKRGSVAHSTVAGHVQLGLNPADEARQVTQIRDGLKALDRELVSLEKIA